MVFETRFALVEGSQDAVKCVDVLPGKPQARFQGPTLPADGVFRVVQDSV